MLLLDYPEFLNTDPRVGHDQSYNPDAEYCENRYTANLPPALIKDKTILDIGSCTGTAGAWALHYGAQHYTGIEIQPEMANASRSNLSKYFDTSRWTIICDDVERVLQDMREVDIILMSGVVYQFEDLMITLNRTAEIAKESIVIESTHPHFYSEILTQHYSHDIFTNHEKDTLHTLFESRTFSEDIRRMFELKMPVVFNRTSDQAFISHNNEYHRTVSNGNYPSIGFLDNFYYIRGYKLDLQPNDLLKQSMPDKFNFPGRFSVRFNRVNNQQAPRYKDNFDV